MGGPLDAGPALRLRESGGGVLLLGAVPDTDFLQRSGLALVGAPMSGGGVPYTNALVTCTSLLVATGGVDTVPFNGAYYDTGGITDIGGAHPERLTATVKGIWRIAYALYWAQAIAATQAGSFITPSNDGVNSYGSINYRIGNGWAYKGRSNVFLDIGDYVRIQFNSGASGTNGHVQGVVASMTLLQVSP